APDARPDPAASAAAAADEDPSIELDLKAVEKAVDLSPGPGAVALAPPPASRPAALDLSPTKNASPDAPRPKPRPVGLSRRSGSLGEIGVKTVVATPRRPAPATPGVAAAATVKAAMPLDRVNLIGVYGGANGLRALLRLPDGEIMRVGDGAVFDGWTVSRIGERSLRMTRGSEAQVLEIVK
ncbi:MAG: hypothetical protein AAGF90_12515, partial [Pseudomonadota bacterium]